MRVKKGQNDRDRYCEARDDRQLLKEGVDEGTDFW